MLDTEKVTSKKIIELIRAQRHPGDRGEWATFAEVRNGTGWDAKKNRYLDLFAVNCWPSKAFRTVAYEMKVDRADFMREILDPTKREFAESVAGECWFATPAGLVRADEVPEGWGLVTVDAKGGLKTVKMPLQRKPEPWAMAFIATLLRKSSDPASTVPMALWTKAGQELTVDDLKAAFALETAAIRRELQNEAREEAQAQHQATIERLQEQLQDAQKLKRLLGPSSG